MMPTKPTLSVVVHSEPSRLQMQAAKRRSSFHPRASRSAVSVATTADSPAIGAGLSRHTGQRCFLGLWAQAMWITLNFRRDPELTQVRVFPAKVVYGVSFDDWYREFSRIPQAKVNAYPRFNLQSLNSHPTLTCTSASFREILAFSPMGDGQAVGFGLGLALGDVFSGTVGWRWGLHAAAILHVVVLAIALTSLAFMSYVLGIVTDSDAAQHMRQPLNIVLLGTGVALVPEGGPNELWENEPFTSVCITVFLDVRGFSMLTSSLYSLPAPVCGLLTNIAVAVFLSRLEHPMPSRLLVLGVDFLLRDGGDVRLPLRISSDTVAFSDICILQVTSKNMDEPIEILGQQPTLKIYTQIAVCFSVEDDQSYANITKTLTSGLERLTAGFPWVAGQIINEGASEGNTGIFKIAPLEPTPPLIVKDLREDPSVSSMKDMKTSGFPFAMLDESIVCPRPTLPIDPNLVGKPEPVFITQATFIKGGLILAFLGHHQVLDGTGQGQLIKLLSKACKGEDFTEEEIATGNLSRHNIIPLLDDFEGGLETDAMIIKPSATPATAPATCSWAYFDFSAASLSALKSLASETVKSGYITTDDALTAFIWQSISRIRMGIPQTFPALIQSMTKNSMAIKDLVERPLGEAASQLRSAVDPTALSYGVRALATLMNQAADKSVFSFTGTLHLDRDLAFSSWAKLDLYEHDFGLGLGKPESVRRPQFTPVESLGYLLPKALDGSIALAICLRDEDMNGLKKDELWLKYSKYIGK
ncbi:trichothecene 3-O-acetyltransferase [Colletotrichum lupini]|uniref:Trichothecene 3-O-acetyltransferase n=1 Tax=Colletotrichum lupini TaxID=145971 RepID=A0A9Q8T285_9PEZI|nr:trichothecene 3-O-acetyltransferase [Colletotrichum lupini]UQC87675.1 trichothecene 3-O-acetyltransferase [Colletotrichum lupini]